MKAPREEAVCLVYPVPRTVHGTEQGMGNSSQKKRKREEERKKRKEGREKRKEWEEREGRRKVEGKKEIKIVRNMTGNNQKQQFQGKMEKKLRKKYHEIAIVKIKPIFTN